jgi:Protein of unknown function (DUF1441)
MADLWSISQLADEFDMDRRTVRKRLDGVAPCGQRKGNPAWRLKVATPHVLLAAGGSEFDDEAVSQRERNEYYDAELKKLKLEVQQKLYIKREEYRADLKEVMQIMVSGVDTLPDMLERECGLDPLLMDALRSRIDVIRETMAEAIDE